jgi:hypothetical protein
MDFSERLEKAVQRGQKRGEARNAAARKKALSVEELRRLHNDQRLAVSDHIEKCVGALANHFPGFEKETIYGDAGWGSAMKRDDAGQRAGSGRANFYSRLEITVRPLSAAFVVEIAAKGTIRNKEVYNRTQYQRLGDVDLAMFNELVDRWVLEYAEMYAAQA